MLAIVEPPPVAVAPVLPAVMPVLDAPAELRLAFGSIVPVISTFEFTYCCRSDGEPPTSENVLVSAVELPDVPVGLVVVGVAGLVVVGVGLVVVGVGLVVVGLVGSVVAVLLEPPDTLASVRTKFSRVDEVEPEVPVAPAVPAAEGSLFKQPVTTTDFASRAVCDVVVGCGSCAPTATAAASVQAIIAPKSWVLFIS